MFDFTGKISGWAGSWALAYYRRAQKRRLMAAPLENARVVFEGVQMNYYHTPYKSKKPNLVLIHGFHDSSLTFRYNVKDLSRHFNLVLIDIPGFGGSGRPHIREFWHIDAFARIMARFLMDQLAIDKFHILGHSMGGLMALHLQKSLVEIGKKKSVQSLHLIAPGAIAMTSRYRNRIRSEFYPQSTKEVHTLISNLFYPEKKDLPEWILRGLLYDWSHPGYEYLALNTIDRERVIFYNETELSKMELPVFLYWGKNDRLVDLKLGKKMHSFLGNSQLYTFPRCGHLMHQTRSMDFFERFMGSF